VKWYLVFRSQKSFIYSCDSSAWKARFIDILVCMYTCVVHWESTLQWYSEWFNERHVISHNAAVRQVAHTVIASLLSTRISFFLALDALTHTPLQLFRLSQVRSSRESCINGDSRSRGVKGDYSSFQRIETTTLLLQKNCLHLHQILMIDQL